MIIITFNYRNNEEISIYIYSAQKVKKLDFD